MKVTTKYSGKSGLYVCVKPASGIKAVVDYIRTGLCIELDVDDLHCTLMYSREHAPHTVSAFKLLNSGPTAYHASVMELESWAGHDNKGYLVAKLFCPMLHERHAQWKKLGARHSFPDYQPHMTLATGVTYSCKDLHKFNLPLSTYPIPLTFSGEHIEDIKG